MAEIAPSAKAGTMVAAVGETEAATVRAPAPRVAGKEAGKCETEAGNITTAK